MKITDPQWSGGFGTLAKYRNIVEIRLSPHELSPFRGLLSKGIPNIFRRFRSQALIAGVPLTSAYILYSWANEANALASRKNPKDYENDK